MSERSETTLGRSSACFSGHVTDLDTGKRRQFDPERRRRDHDVDEAHLGTWLDPGVRRVQSNARRHNSTMSLSGMQRKNGRIASGKSEGPTTTGGG